MKKLLVVAGLLTSGSCTDRSLDGWRDRVAAVCVDFCEVNTTCNEGSPYYPDDQAGCEAACQEQETLDEPDDCGESRLAFQECLGALTCEEREQYSEGTLAGADEYPCRDESLTYADTC